MYGGFRDSYSCVGFYFCFCSCYAYSFCWLLSQHLCQSVFWELLRLASSEAALVCLDLVRTLSLWALVLASSLHFCIPNIASQWFDLPWPWPCWVRDLLLLQSFVAIFLLGLYHHSEQHWANFCSPSHAYQTSVRISCHWIRVWERVSSHYCFQYRLQIQRSSTLHYCYSCQNRCTLDEFDALFREIVLLRASFSLLILAHVNSLLCTLRVRSSGCASQLPVWSPNCNRSLLWLQLHFQCWLCPLFHCCKRVSCCDAHFDQSWLLCELATFSLPLVLQTELLVILASRRSRLL